MGEDIKVVLMHEKQFVITRRDFEDYSLSYLPCYQGYQGNGGYIVSSDNGLLLCGNWYRAAESNFYVCNPLTRQWVSIPPPPRPAISGSSSANLLPVGFTCTNEGRFRILRAFGSSSSFSDSEFDVDIFSSETWEWKNVKVSREREYKEGCCFSPNRVVALNGKFYVQVGRSLVVYDPYTHKLDADIDAPKEANNYGRSKVWMPLHGYSCSDGALWATQINNRNSMLFVWKLKENRWNLEKQISQWKWKTNNLAKKCLRYGRVLTLDPQNPSILFVCLIYDAKIVEWNLETGSTQVVFDQFQPDFFPSWVDAFCFQTPVVPRPASEFSFVFSSKLLACGLLLATTCFTNNQLRTPNVG